MAKILLAEDDQFIRDVYAEMLQSAKYEVVSAADGEKAFQLIKQGGWDIVLLDMMMPKMTGQEILRELKEFKQYSFTKHLLLMTNNEETTELKENKYMYDDYILKSSITPGELLEIVKHYLKN